MTAPKADLVETRTFQSEPASLFDVREFIRARAQDADLSGDEMNDLVLAVSEACANAVLHAQGPSITVTWQLERAAINIEVEDQGQFRRRVPMAEFDERQGHGIPLMIALVDEVDIREGTERRPGTVVRLVKYRES